MLSNRLILRSGVGRRALKARRVTRPAQQLPLSPVASPAGEASLGQAAWHRAGSRLLAAQLAAPLAAALAG